MTKYIKAPFNFVPLNEKVILPEWAAEVSQDMPFEDGIDGELEISIEAKSPLFVRNGYTREQGVKKDSEYKKFSHHNGQHFIPATSVKGMIRNVLEIISFGKMDRISNDRYAMRDLNNRKDYLEKMTGEETYCGWLNIKNENEIEITDCGIPGRLSHNEIDVISNKGFSEKFGNGPKRIDFTKESNRTAKFKYNAFGTNNLSFHFVSDTDKMDRRSGVDKRDFYKKTKDHEGKLGTLVFTGQPSARKKSFDPRKRKETWRGKFYEFIFFEPEARKVEKLSTSSEIWKDFLFIHKESDDWKYLKQTFKGRIPVFFKRDEQNKIESIGISYLYKLPYTNRIKDCLPAQHKADKPDFAALLLGDSTSGLKGRVQFGHAFLTSEVTYKSELAPLMGSPKPSYYPIYLTQKGENGLLKEPYTTYMSPNALLKGRKRFPVQKSSFTNFQVDTTQKDNTNPFIPLAEGSVFTQKIRFHNLKPLEVGGLIQALTIFGKTDTFHTIGFAKPYGYGKVKISILNFSASQKSNTDMETCVKLYDQYINEQIQDGNNITDELVLMAKEHNNSERSELQYMVLQDFPKMKGKKNPLNQPQYLDYYSNLLGQKKTLPFQANENIVKKETKEEVFKPDITKEKIENTAGLIKAKITGKKKAVLADEKIEVQLVIPKTKLNIPLDQGLEVWVIIKQKSKDGRIVQVEYQGLV